MSVNTKAIIRKDVTVKQILEIIEEKYSEVKLYPTHISEYFYICFVNTENERRSINVFLGDYAKNDYNIDGVLLDMYCDHFSVKTMNMFLDKFGGYLLENDCNGDEMKPVNIDEFLKSSLITEEEIFVNKIIQTVGMEKLDSVLKLFKEFKTIGL